MNLEFNTLSVENYHSPAQMARVLTESWINENMFCPRCGNKHIKRFPNNRPVADFYCPECQCEYELKSKNGSIGKKVTDGAYHTMIERINSNNNPDFLFMGYSRSEMSVKNLFLIPKHFFVPQIIEKRRPLSDNARRAGWTGCNILLDKIPNQGRIDIVSDEHISDITTVVNRVNKAYKLEIDNIDARGWLLDILICISSLSKTVFTLDEIYLFEEKLHEKHPDNNNIKPKIRQQLQILRDRGFVEFLGNGTYRMIN